MKFGTYLEFLTLLKTDFDVDAYSYDQAKVKNLFEHCKKALIKGESDQEAIAAIKKMIYEEKNKTSPF